MAIRKHHLVLFFAIFFTLAVSTVISSIPAAAAVENGKSDDAPGEDLKVALTGKEWTGDGNNLNLGLLQVGDIIAVKGVIKIAGLAEWYMGYSHVAIYIGNGEMVEAFSEGVRVAPSSMIHNADCAELVRVSTTTSKKYAAVNFMLQQVGKPYDYQWVSIYFGGKEVYGSSYYCSELAWAGYIVAGGPDIDQNPGWSWKYGPNVAPQEVVDDGDTYRVAYSS